MVAAFPAITYPKHQPWDILELFTRICELTGKQVVPATALKVLKALGRALLQRGQKRGKLMLKLTCR